MYSFILGLVLSMSTLAGYSVNTHIVEIEDNGHGMDIEKWEKDPANSGKGNSIGLANVKQRLELLAKIKSSEFSISFENIQKNPRNGTRVLLKIPQ